MSYFTCLSSIFYLFCVLSFAGLATAGEMASDKTIKDFDSSKIGKIKDAIKTPGKSTNGPDRKPAYPPDGCIFNPECIVAPPHEKSR